MMPPSRPLLLRCRGCGVMMWVSDTVPIGSIPGPLDGLRRAPAEVPDEWRTLDYVADLDAGSYMDAVEAGLADDDFEERLLRIRAWWKGNDLHRGLSEPGDCTAGTPRWRANILALFDLLEDDPADDSRRDGTRKPALRKRNRAPGWARTT